MGVLIPALRKRRTVDAKKGEQKPAGAVGSIRLFTRFISGQRRLFTMAALMLIFEAATAVYIPLLVAFVINYLTARLAQIDGKAVLPPASPLALLGLPTIINPDVDTIAVITVGIVLLTMVNSLGDSLAEIYLAKAGRRLGYDLRLSLYTHLQKLSLAFHDQRRTGDILTRITSDVVALEDFIISSFSDFAGSILLIFFILIAMVRYRWQVAVVAAVIIPIMALISNYFTTRIKSASKKRRASEGELASAAQEMLTSIRVIQTYGLGSYESGMFAEQSQKAMDSALEAAQLQARFSWVVSVMGAISTAAVIWMAVWLIFRDPLAGIGIGLLTAFIKYIQDMFKPTKRIIQEWNTLGKLYASLERIADLLDRRPAVQDLPDAGEAPRFQGKIEFRNVSFAYQFNVSDAKNQDEDQLRMALKNINFTIEPGQVMALVGYTGAGKSTVVQLLPRLYDPMDGQILIDGHDIREFTLESLRAQMSMVLQETILFSGSVVENVAYGRTDATWAEIITSAKQANAHEFIEKMPQGYYTLLGERGANLSGGQRQRIAIARAFIRNTPILILDEPSTGLDAESTDLVLRALRELMKGKTTIIVSHDLNLIRNADKIVVIKGGEIEQIGTHDELIAAGGLYANLYFKQSGQSETEHLAWPAGAIPSGSDRIPGLPPGTNGARSPALQMLNLDLPRSPALHHRLPSLATAFDGQSMQDTLQAILFGPAGSSYSIERCVPGKALYMPGNICNLQYQLEVKDESTGQVLHTLINARLYPELADCEIYLHDCLEPLALRMRGRPEIEALHSPVAVLDDLKMALSVFPIDGQLPTLIGATDRPRMIKIFNETLPEALSGSFRIEDLRYEIAHYGRYQRCVLRYFIDGRVPEDNAPQSKLIYGKVDADGYGGLTIPVLTALHERTREGPSAFRFTIPRALGFLPDLKLLLLEALPGGPQVSKLLKARLGSEAAQIGMPSLEASIEACARIAAALHSSGIKLGRRRNFQDEIEWLQTEMQGMEQVFPDLGGQLHTWLDEIIAYAEEHPALPLCFNHGDFTYSQLIFDGHESGLVDFDSVCQAEPALDLGQFLAYQRLAILKEQNPDAPMSPEDVEELCELFLNTYFKASRDWLGDENLLRTRVTVYEIISLIRLAVHSWEKLKGSRLKYAVTLLEERIQCLAQVR